ncbi:Pyruvate dehydrogenase phosphatase regulatory subunit, mitochondrial [Nymphon striatum]|nr:Pyruvate dehydrogenase phosphatase regulatory subunit, mitochondrial [Nymphon striatum]
MLRKLHTLCQIIPIKQPLNSSLPLSTSSAVISLPPHSRVVIGGGGILSNLIAYHLLQKGWNDILVIDKERSREEELWRGSGILNHLRINSESRLVQYTASLFDKIQKDGYNLGWKRCSSLHVARTNDRLVYLKKLMASCQPNGTDCEVVTLEQMKNLNPYLNTDGLVGGVWMPSDGVVDANLVCSVFANLSKARGVKYVENCEIRNVDIIDSRVERVMTDRGNVSCDVFINCLGLWSRSIGLASKPEVRIPVHSAELFYLITNEVEDMPESLPTLHDNDGGIYARKWNNGFLAGGISPHASVSRVNHTNSSNTGPLFTELKRRFPVFKNTSIEQIVKGYGNFTADGKWLFGVAPGIENYYVAVGMNGNSVIAAGGIAKAVAQLIAENKTQFEILPFDVRRFTKAHNNEMYLRERAKEIVGRYFAIHYPLQSEFRSARKLRCSPLYTEQAAAGAVFGERMGFERALYFNTNIEGNEFHNNPELPPGTFMAPEWIDFVREEYFHCRESVSVIDMSSYAKFEIKSAGLEVLDYLQYLCCNNVDIPIGAIVQTGMQNEQGGYENDCIIFRPAENRFFMVSPTAQETRILDWMNHFLPLDGSVAISNVTSMYTVLNIVGPKSEQLMSELTAHNMNIPFFRFLDIDIGYASGVTIMRYTSTGEPGYSLYIPSEYALHIYKKLMEAGRDFGIRNAGYFTLRFLRIEKFIPFWAEELDSNATPVEAGLMNTIHFEKENFIGRDALLQQCKEGVKKKLVLFVLDKHSVDTDVWPWGKEPIYRNGQYIGMTTSSGYGFSLGRMVCLGYIYNVDRITNESKIVTNEYINDRQAVYEINIAGKIFPARPSLKAPIIPVVKMGGLQTRYVPKVNR